MKKFLIFILISFIVAFPIIARTWVYETDASIDTAVLNKTITPIGPCNLKSVAITFTNALGGATMETSILIKDPNGITKELDNTAWSTGDRTFIWYPQNDGYPLVRHYQQDDGIDVLVIETNYNEGSNGVSIEVICED